MNRRHFLMSTAVMAGSAAMKGLAQSPNERVRIAVVGLGGRGGSHVNAWSRMANVEIAGICDVDESHIGEKFKLLEARGGKAPTTFVDFRKILDDKSIDAVSIATPNHWHTLMTIWACQAGKDVYVEKPCSHNVFESQQIVAAARKYDRIVQQGSQSRSSPALREAVQRMREGEFGEVYMARGLCYKWRDTIGKTPVEPVPPGVDYDLWTGPAPKRPFTKNRFHYNWHWFWDTGNGDLGNQGIHEVDMPLGPRRDAPDQGHRDRRQVHVRRRPGDAEHDLGELRVRRRRQEEDDDLRSPPLDLAARSGHPGGQAGQHHREPVLRLEGLPGHRQLQQVLLVHGQGPDAGADRNCAATPTGRTSSTPSAAASARISMPRSKKARCPATWCTWPTSATASAARSTGTRRTCSASATTRPTRC